jgi:subtilisin family serine protease
VKSLKQAVCLVVVGSGLALTPLTMADASADHPGLNAEPGQIDLGSGSDSDEGIDRLPPSLAKAAKKGRQAFLVVLRGRPTTTVYDEANEDGTEAQAIRAAKSRLQAITQAQETAIAELPSASSVIYRTHAVLPGFAVTTAGTNLGKLKSLPGATAVYPIAPKSTDNAYAVPLQGGAAAWTAHGNLGAGTTVAVIDTGIDYTHANFGGPGTVAAFDTAQAADGRDDSVFPGTKVIGGYDLAGDAYDADTGTAPDPDPYPLDCNGHGSHVAGTVAGLGENADGSTYTGAYDSSTPFDTMKIGPGMAPAAKLYAFRVFGCEGTTNLTAAAIDMAVDPNGDGDPSDAADVINMSLGSAFGDYEDGDTVAATAAAAAGVTVSNSAGNSGDVQDVSGSPGNAPTSITVANSTDASEVSDGFTYQIGADSPVTGAATRAVLYDWSSGPDLTGPMVLAPATNQTACTGFTPSEAATIAGKVVLVKWTQEALECGSIARGANLRAAGATGFVFANSAENFDAGINGDTVIPGVLLAKSDADAIRTALTASTAVTAVGTSVNSVRREFPDENDRVNPSSSRGIHAAGNAKPDIAAVGTTVFSTGVGTGTDGATFSGTSMAAPMVAGSAALVIAEHPDWTPEQVKAALMNTAGQDLYENGSAAVDPGATYAPNRVGAGRLQVDAALDNSVLAYNSDDPGVVSVSFGPVEVAAATTLTKHVKVQNTGLTSKTFDVSYDAITSVPGVSFSVSPSQVSVGARSATTVTVTLSAPDPSVLTKSVDPTVGRTSQLGYPRETLADASGRVLLEPTSGGDPTLRVPVYAAPRPASTMTQAATLPMPGGTDTASLALTGADLGSGGTNGLGDADPDNDIFSIAAGFELTATSGTSPQCSATVTIACWRISEEKAADLKYLGVTSDYPVYENPVQSQAYFAVSARAPVSTPASKIQYQIDIDVDGDNEPDLFLWNDRLYSGADPTDVMVTTLYDPSVGVVDVELLNSRFGDLDTALYDTDSMILPLYLDVMTDYGITPANPTITYGVETYSAYSAQPIDLVGVNPATGDLTGMKANLYAPALSVADGAGNTPLMEDVTGDSLTVTRNAASFAADGGQGLLMLHLHNKVGSKAQVVDIKAATTVAGTHAPEPSTFGTASTLNVTVSGAGTAPTGAVTVKEGATTIGTATLTAGKGSVALPATLSVGSHSFALSYSGDTTYASSTGTASATVAPGPPAPPVASTTTAETPRKIKQGKRILVAVSVTAPGTTPTGEVQIRTDGKLVGSGTLAGGSVVIALTKKLKPGKHTLVVSYGGSATVAPSQTTVQVKVVKRHKRH